MAREVAANCAMYFAAYVKTPARQCRNVSLHSIKAELDLKCKGLSVQLDKIGFHFIHHDP